jgi:hypothetical protein
VSAISWLGFAIGVLLLLGTTSSIVGTLVVPRSINSLISRNCDSVTDYLFRMASWRIRQFPTRDRLLAWQAPLSLLIRLCVWIALLYLAFALTLLPFVPHARSAFSEAGSSMFTLGYAGPTSGGTTAIDYLAAFTGLVVVGLQIGYLPTLYAAFNRRETEVTLLISRAGVPAWGPELLARTQYGIPDGDFGPNLANLFTQWERWSAEVAESHATYLSLVRFRSPRPLSHWLISLLAVMDAAALHLSVAPSHEPKLSARLCLRMGFTCLRQVAGAMGLAVDEDPDPDRAIDVTAADFEAAVQLLVDQGYPVESSAQDAFPHFRGWRVNYEALAYAIARATDAPPALWSGPRRWPSTPIPPLRPSNRLPRPR